MHCCRAAGSGLAVFATYLDKGVFTVSPVETIDSDCVGRLVKIAVEEGRRTKPGLKLGVCGEHGGDPESIHFFHTIGLDYVSCSPFRVPVARLEAGRAAVSCTGETGNASWGSPGLLRHRVAGRSGTARCATRTALLWRFGGRPRVALGEVFSGVSR